MGRCARGYRRLKKDAPHSRLACCISSNCGPPSYHPPHGGRLCACFVAVASNLSETTAQSVLSPSALTTLPPPQGWNNVGYHASSQPNAKEVVTPNIDALAASGVILDRFYAYRFCSPSRSSFLTGRNPIHVNTGNDALTLYNPKDQVSGFAGIPRNMTAIAEKLASVGYNTVQAGKVRRSSLLGALRGAPSSAILLSLSHTLTHTKKTPFRSGTSGLPRPTTRRKGGASSTPSPSEFPRIPTSRAFFFAAKSAKALDPLSH